MESLLRMALAQFDQAEVYRTELEVRECVLTAAGRASVRVDRTGGTALRVCTGDRIYLTSAAGGAPPLPERALVQAAGRPWSGEFPGPAAAPALAAYDPRVASLTLDDLAREADALRRQFSALAPGFPFRVWVQATTEQVAIANSAQLQCEFRRTGYLVGIDEDVILAGGDYREADPAHLRRLVPYLQPAQVAEPLADGSYQVLLEPSVVLVLLQRFVEGVRWEAVRQGRSALDGQLGKPIFDPRIGIEENPLLPFGYHSRPFDDEGVVARPQLLVENGRLMRYLYDLSAARETGQQGNGYKVTADGGGLAIAANPQPTNLRLLPGSADPETLLPAIADGVAIASTFGNYEGDVCQGEFTLGVRRGLRVVNGQVTGAVRNLSVSGNIYEALRGGVQAVGSQCQPGNLYDNIMPRRIGHAPALLLGGIAIKQS